MSKVLIASFVTSIRYEVSGVIADLLLKESETQLSYSLVSLGLFLTSGFEASNGLRAVQVIFFIFTLLIPLALVTVLLILLLMPLTTRDQVRLMKVCHVLDAWAAFDVFVIAVVVANFEFWLLTEFLIYHDNIASACNLDPRELGKQCRLFGHAMSCSARLYFNGIGRSFILSHTQAIFPILPWLFGRGCAILWIWRGAPKEVREMTAAVEQKMVAATLIFVWRNLRCEFFFVLRGFAWKMSEVTSYLLHSWCLSSSRSYLLVCTHGWEV